jgi:hypothetical protein
MRDSDKRQLDAYLAGELSPSGQRALAQAALDDPELFELLAAAAVVNTHAGTAVEVSRRSRPRRGWWAAAGAGAAAAAVVAAMVSVDRSSRGVTTPVATAPPATPATVTTGSPPAAIAQPIILAALLGDINGPSTPTFRTAAESSRAPKDAGVVVSVQDGDVAIDLGSLDGVVKGSDLRVSRGGSSVGRLTIATVFRERARGRTSSPEAIRVGDRVEIPSALQLNALLEQMQSRAAAGDREAAHALARRAATVSASVTGVDATLNEIAAVLIANGDDGDAEALLQRAQPAAGITAVRVANNLGALAARRGDVETAERLYRSALTLPGTGADFEAARRSVDANLEKLSPR